MLCKGAIGTAKLYGRMKCEGYCSILKHYLLPGAHRCFAEKWGFQQENISVHASNFNKPLLGSFDVDVLELPTKSSDLNIIDNVWRKLARAACAVGRQYNCVADLGAAVGKKEDGLLYLQNRYKPIPNSRLDVIGRKGRMIKY